MRPRRPDTFMLTLPDGRKVRCWRRDAQAIREDVALTGNVILVQAPGSEVYDRVAPGSLEAAALAPHARRVR
jgi:hypothetical protein